MKPVETNNETNLETSKVSKDGTKRGQNKNSRKNLIPVVEGEVRNPNGRPSGIMDFRKRVEVAITFLAEQFVAKHNADPKNASNKMKIEDVDIMGDVFAQLVNQARNGNLKAVDSLMDRVYGKAKQPVEVTGANGGAVEYSVEMKEAHEEVDRWVEEWTKRKADDNNTEPRTEAKADTK